MRTIVRRPKQTFQVKLTKGETNLKPEKAFGSVLRDKREKNKISQEQLALISGLDRTFISLLERGLRQPSLTSILQISKSLNITASELMNQIEKKLDSDE